MSSRFTAQSPLAGRTASRTRPSMSECDWLFSWTECQMKEIEAKELKRKYKERKQLLENLEQRIKELQKEIEETHELRYNFEMFLKDEEADIAVRRAEREMKALQEKEAKIEELKKEYAEMTERKQELLSQVQIYSVYKDFMEEVLNLTTFEDVDALTGYFESLLHFRDQLYQKENQVQDQVDQQRKALLKLNDQHDLLFLQKNNQLSQLQTELEKTRSEAIIWERKWNHIQETAAKKTLELGQIKMATLNLYELTDGIVGPEGVAINDTDKQLEQIKMYINDQNDILKQYQTLLRRSADGDKQEKTKNKRKKAKNNQ
ncbi:coiled-coil domain-containing protein 42 homolog [Leuresthes tenuis]|uniref:coiled-coil domain-containing protein 42 homolog n=1 Tax=Leuresthes tenuis TaxID=355514 RepID=UPI003B50A3C2